MSKREAYSALGEWRNYGYLPFVAAIGYSTMAIQTYGVGPFIAPLEQEFGWSRAQVLTGLTISNGFGVALNFAVGMLVDRIGPRRVGLAGVVMKTAGIALLATATGSMLNWSLLWVLVAMGAMFTQATVWTTAVASRFNRGRGLALAIALSGSSLCGAVIPILATWLIGQHGWRPAMVITAAVWLAVAFPLVFFLFRGRQDDHRSAEEREAARAATAKLPGLTMREGLRTRAFWMLVVSGFSYAFYTTAVSPNLVPMLQEKGAGMAGAAEIAALVGVVGIFARISAGWLLDHMSARLLGVIVFLLPVAGCSLILGDAPGMVLLAFAVVSFGVTIGAEYDIVFYLTSRHFGLRSFGAMIGGVLTAGSLGGTVAPVVAGWLHDRYGSYDVMLMLLMALMAIGALAIAFMGREPEEFARLPH